MKRAAAFATGFVLAAIPFYLLPNRTRVVQYRSITLHIALGLAFPALILLGIRKKMPGWALLGASVLHLIPVLRLYLNDHSPQGTVFLKVLHSNLLYLGPHRRAAIRKLAEMEADFLSLVEVDRQWAGFLEERLSRIYPYRYLLPRSDTYGEAVYSRYPLEEINVYYWHGMPVLSGLILKKKKAIRFLIVHLRAPMHEKESRKRDKQAEAMLNDLHRFSEPLIVLGDWNMVSWDPVMRKFIRLTGLKDSRNGYKPTFPHRLGWLGIPLDHILYSKQLKCLGFSTFFVPGSDHKGIVSEFAATGAELKNK